MRPGISYPVRRFGRESICTSEFPARSRRRATLSLYVEVGRSAIRGRPRSAVLEVGRSGPRALLQAGDCETAGRRALRSGPRSGTGGERRRPRGAPRSAAPATRGVGRVAAGHRRSASDDRRRSLGSISVLRRASEVARHGDADCTRRNPRFDVPLVTSALPRLPTR